MMGVIHIYKTYFIIITLIGLKIKCEYPVYKVNTDSVAPKHKMPANRHVWSIQNTLRERL